VVAGPVVGVLGAGQLGRMLALAGLPLGLRFRFYDPAEAPCAAAVGAHHRGAWDDTAALDAFADAVDLLTWEFESVPVATARRVLERLGSDLSTSALEVGQDRWVEKQALEASGIGVAPYRAVNTAFELADAVATLGGDVIAKTRRGGYDGKGQIRLTDPADASAAFESLGGRPLVVEQRLKFERELAVLVVRAHDGSTRSYPVTETVQRSGVLHGAVAPAPALDPVRGQAAVVAAERLAASLGYVGVLALELFDLGDRLLGNEFAPRVHNSGHWTIEGSRCGQFENHVRAVAGLPLGDPGMAADGIAMANCLGRVPPAAMLLEDVEAHLHDYGKEPREGRKVGHVTWVARDPNRASLLAQRVRGPDPPWRRTAAEGKPG
jgi:5-(carboxyamino)imidazole ribonucleotide synthase